MSPAAQRRVYVSASGAQPAYLTTKDPVTQFVIENSQEFKNNFIQLSLQQTIPGQHPRLATPKTQEQNNTKQYPNVTKTQEAKEILKNEYNYNTDNIRSKEQAKQAAAELNITFPNL